MLSKNIYEPSKQMNVRIISLDRNLKLSIHNSAMSQQGTSNDAKSLSCWGNYKTDSAANRWRVGTPRGIHVGIGFISRMLRSTPGWTHLSLHAILQVAFLKPLHSCEHTHRSNTRIGNTNIQFRHRQQSIKARESVLTFWETLLWYALVTVVSWPASSRFSIGNADPFQSTGKTHPELCTSWSVKFSFTTLTRFDKFPPGNEIL